MGGGKRAPATPSPQKKTRGLSPATPQKTQASRVRSQDRSPATGQTSEDGQPFKAGSPLKPVPWELSEMISDDDTRSPTTTASKVGTACRVPQPVLEFANENYPVGHVCEWAPGKYPERGAKDVRLVLRVVPLGDENEGVKLDEKSIQVAITDGRTTWYADHDHLRPLSDVPEMLPRYFSHALASPSSRSDVASPDRWGWLTPEGLGDADRREVTVLCSAVPHLVGRRGQTVRAAEDALGVLIGVIDGTDDQATVTLIGPLAQVVLAREVIAALAVGARSILTRLIKPD